MTYQHVRLGIPMDRMYCEVNDFNHQITSHAFYIHRQYKVGKIWFCERRCRLCTFMETSAIDHPVTIAPNVER